MNNVSTVMEYNKFMSQSERKRVDIDVEKANKILGLKKGKMYKPEMGKDDFLKILVTQLANQDPTAPMEDKEFIAQMAQFTSLEQMTNMSKGFAELSDKLNLTSAMSLIGKNVSLKSENGVISGKVSEVKGGDFPQLKIENKFYQYSDLISIKE